MAYHVSVAGGTPTWRRGMKAILEDFGHRVELLETLKEWRPGFGGIAVVFHDDTDSAADLLRTHVEDHPHIPAIAVVEKLTASSYARWVRAGAFAVLDELEDSESVASTLEVAVEGKALVRLPVLRALAQAMPTEEEFVDQLSDDEMSWLRGMAAGQTVMELAEDSGYSERAMFRQLRILYERVGVRNRTEALLWASRAGLLVDPPE